MMHSVQHRMESSGNESHHGSSRAAMRDRARRWRREGGGGGGGGGHRGGNGMNRNDNQDVVMGRSAAAIAVDRFESSMSGWDDCADVGDADHFDRRDFVVSPPSPGTPNPPASRAGGRGGGGGGSVVSSGDWNSSSVAHRRPQREREQPQTTQRQFVAVAYSDRIEVPSPPPPPPPPAKTRTPSPKPMIPVPGIGVDDDDDDGLRSPDISWGQEEPPSPVVPVVPSWRRPEHQEQLPRPQDQQHRPQDQPQDQTKARDGAGHPHGRASPTSPFDESPLVRHGKGMEVANRDHDDYDDGYHENWQHDDGISNVSSSYVVREIPPEDEDEDDDNGAAVVERGGAEGDDPMLSGRHRGGDQRTGGSVLASPPPEHRPGGGGDGGRSTNTAGKAAAPSVGGVGAAKRGKVAALAHMFSSRATVVRDGGPGSRPGSGSGPGGSAEGTPTQRHDVRKRWGAGTSGGDSSSARSPRSPDEVAGGNSGGSNKKDNSISALSPATAKNTMRATSILNATNDSSTSGGTTNTSNTNGNTTSFDSSFSSTDATRSDTLNRPSPKHHHNREASAGSSKPPAHVGWPGTEDDHLDGEGAVRMPSARITVTTTTGGTAPPPRPPAGAKSSSATTAVRRRSSCSSPPPDLAAANTSSYTTGSSGKDTSDDWDEASGDGSFAHAIAVPDTTFELSTSAIEPSKSSGRPEAREKIEIIPSLASISAMGTGGVNSTGRSARQQSSPHLPPRSSLSKFRGGRTSPTAADSSRANAEPGQTADEESSEDVGYSSFRTGPGGVLSTSHSSGGTGEQPHHNRRNNNDASTSSPSYASFDTSPSAVERSMEALETSSGIDISGSHRRVLSSGRMSDALSDHIRRSSLSPPASGANEGEEHEEGPTPSEDHTPTEEALALQNSFAAPARPVHGNAMNVRGFSGFINKTTDVPNLMDDEEDETEGDESGENPTLTAPASAVDENGFPTQESSSSGRRFGGRVGMLGGNSIGEDTTFVSQLTEEVETTIGGNEDEGAESDVFDGLSEIAGGGGAGRAGGDGEYDEDDVDNGVGSGFAAARAKFMRDAPAASGWGGRGSARDQFLNESPSSSQLKTGMTTEEESWRQSPQQENRSDNANSAVVTSVNAVRKGQLQSGRVGQRIALRPVPKVSQQQGTASSATNGTGGILRPGGGPSTSSKILDRVSIFDKNAKHAQPQPPPSPSPSNPKMTHPMELFDDANVALHDGGDVVNGGGRNANTRTSPGDDSSSHPEEEGEDEEEEWMDLSEYYVDPADARKLVRRYRKLCNRFGGGGGGNDEYDEEEEDAKKAFALFEMRSRIMETDIERGLARRGGTAPVDDIVLTASHLATLRVRDAVIVSKAWRDGASPADVTTASLLTRRETHSYLVRRTVIDTRKRRVSVHMEEREWLDDVDVLNYRCASSLDGSQAGTCLRGFDIFTVGDCQSLLLKLANERCMQLRKELERATQLQLEAEEILNDEEGNREDMYGSSRVSEAEMMYIRAAEEVSTITQSLVRAEKSFELVRDRIARLIAQYESRLIQMEDEEGSYYRSEDDDDFSGGSYSDGGSYYDDEYDESAGESDGDWEKEELAMRAEEAEHRAEEASREAVQAKKEAERIRLEKQRELEALQNRLAELEQKSVLERQRSEDLVNKYEQQLEAERQSAMEKQSALEKQSSFSAGNGNGNPLDKSDARSLLQSAVGAKDQEKIDSLKERFRARHAQRGGAGRRGPPTHNRRPPGGAAAATEGRSSGTPSKPGGASRVSQYYNSPHRGSGGDVRMSPRRRNQGEEMFQHIDFYERSLQAVENRY